MRQLEIANPGFKQPISIPITEDRVEAYIYAKLRNMPDETIMKMGTEGNNDYAGLLFYIKKVDGINDIINNTSVSLISETPYAIEFIYHMAAAIPNNAVGDNNRLQQYVKNTLIAAALIDALREYIFPGRSLNHVSAVTTLKTDTPTHDGTLYRIPVTFNANDLAMIEQYALEMHRKYGVPMPVVRAFLLALTPGDPLVIDVAGVGINLQNQSESHVHFDYTNNGFGVHTGWIKQGSGFLVKQEADGSIHLFTGTASGGDGFAELGTMDTNGDGSITSLDAEFSSLKVWMDLNGNGKVDAGELLSLADSSILSIGLVHSTVSQDVAGNTVTGIGSVTMTDGTQRGIYDVNFQVDTMDTQADNLPTLTAEIQAMPQLHGYGRLMDLRSSMVGNVSLQTAVEAFTTLVTSSTAATDDLRSALRDIMFAWSDAAGVAPSSRGDVIDARRLEFVEKYVGQMMHFAGYYGTDMNPGMLPSLMVNQGWKRVETSLLGELLVQVDPMLSQSFVYEEAQGLVVPKTDLQTDLRTVATELGAVSSSNLDRWTQVATVLSSMQDGIMFGSGTFSDMLASYGAGMKDVGILVAAVSQGLAVSFDASGALHISNSPSDGILDSGYGRNSGLSLVYEPGDGAVQVDFINPSWLTLIQGWTPNTLYLGMNSKDTTSTLLPNGDMVISDGITGDSLTLTGEALAWVSYQRGVQDFTFADGVHWHGPRVTAGMGDTAMLPSYAGVTYDPAGHASDVTTVGDGNALAYASGYGDVTLHVSGVNDSIVLASSINRTDVVMTIDRLTNLVSITDGKVGDSITVTDNWYYDYSGVHSRVAALQFADGSSPTLGVDMPFTWQGTASMTKLSGTDLGRNRFILGAGADTVTGGTRGNTFVMSTGIGHATATSAVGTDTIELAAGIIPSDVMLQSDAAGDLIVTLKGHPDDTLTILGDLQRYGDGTHSLVSSLTFADGTSATLGVGMSFIWQPTPGSSVIGSGWGANTFLMSKDAHYLGGTGQQGGSIENTYVMGAAGVGQSTIDSRGSWSTLVLPEGIVHDDVVFGSEFSYCVTMYNLHSTMQTTNYKLKFYAKSAL